MKGTPFGGGAIVPSCLQAPVPAVQGPREGDAPNLETKPVAGRRGKTEKLGVCNEEEHTLQVSEQPHVTCGRASHDWNLPRENPHRHQGEKM